MLLFVDIRVSLCIQILMLPDLFLVLHSTVTCTRLESELELQADCVELFPALHVCLFTLSPRVKQLL